MAVKDCSQNSLLGLSPRQDEPHHTYGIIHLPVGLLLEIFYELEISHRQRLRRVSREWLRELSTIYLQGVVRMDVPIYMAGFDPHFRFESFPALKLRWDMAARQPSAILDALNWLLSRLAQAVTSHTKVLQLNWIECTNNYTLLESMTTWFFLIMMVTVAKEDIVGRRIGDNVSYLLLDNFSGADGIRNLSVIEQLGGISGAPYIPISTIAFRRCRFDLIGHFVSFFNMPSGYPDCEFELLPMECPAWSHVSLRILRLGMGPEELEKYMVQELNQTFPTLPQSLLDMLSRKAAQLPEAATERWKKELTRNEPIFHGLKNEEIDLEGVEWSHLRPCSLLFFLSFKRLV
ncbi:hypothetical protein RvY_13553 [Ramazzottius varieornatus]|uniref:F-box domain-containing protein n=1 Tax=Ramazzottius varieornatus TaxID=947166 RepID=A0A1D1VQ35_RAMVA|nr:hypothetical protein RvY_13553 [Ramazzottius varieornatus]